MSPGEKVLIKSGLPTEDTVKLEFSVISDKSNWDTWILYQINKNLHTISIHLNPTSSSHLGLYSLNIKLTDNGGDSADPPNEEDMDVKT